MNGKNQKETDNKLVKKLVKDTRYFIKYLVFL